MGRPPTRIVVHKIMKNEPSLDRDRWLLALCLGAAALALGYALQYNGGVLNPTSILCLTLAFGLVLVGLAVPASRLSRFGERSVLFLTGLGLIFQLSQLLTQSPGIYVRYTRPIDFAPFLLAVGLALGVAVSMFWPALGLKPLRVPALVGCYLIAGVWMIHASPDPLIDVYVFQKGATQTLMAGQNPYTMIYADIYHDPTFYGPGVVVDGKLTIGFPYTPLSLLLAVPGQALGGDYRYSQLVATALAALFLAYARPGSLGTAAAAFLLFTPRAFFVLEQGWTEPFVVLLMAVSVFLACRGSRWLPVSLGLMIVTKQYMVLALPLMFLLLPRLLPPWKEIFKQLMIVGGVALAVSLPLALWNLPAFWYSVFTFQVLQPFRPDSLSYMAWAYQQWAILLPVALAFAVTAAAIGLACWRAPRTPAGFAAGLALVGLAFFAFNKQAFCHYYYFVLGAMCCGLAATQPEDVLQTR